MARPPQARANRAAVAEQRIKCYRLRLAGMSIRAISDATGLSVGTVHSRIRAEIDAQVSPLADESMTLELGRLDYWLVKLNQEIEAGRGVARCVEVGIRLVERRARLLGLDSPAKSRVEVFTLDALDEQIALLEAELAIHGAEGGDDSDN